MTRHKHADLIHAWAEGAEIEYKAATGVWFPAVKNEPLWGDTIQYRIKPKTKTVRYRTYLSLDFAVKTLSRCESTDLLWCTMPADLRHWLGEWLSVEVPVE